MLKIICLFLLSLTLCPFSFADEQTRALVEAAKERTRQSVIYNGAYFKIDYPNGDVTAKVGVCTDVVISSYRRLGIAVRRLGHEALRDHFAEYPARRI